MGASPITVVPAVLLVVTVPVVMTTAVDASYGFSATFGALLVVAVGLALPLPVPLGDSPTPVGSGLGFGAGLSGAAAPLSLVFGRGWGRPGRRDEPTSPRGGRRRVGAETPDDSVSKRS